MCFCTPTIRAVICNNCNKYVTDLQAQLKATQDELEMVKADNWLCAAQENKQVDELHEQLAELNKDFNELFNECEEYKETLLAVTRQRDAAIELYEQALKASWPDGAMGDAFDYWNSARAVLKGEL